MSQLVTRPLLGRYLDSARAKWTLARLSSGGYLLPERGKQLQTPGSVWKTGGAESASSIHGRGKFQLHAVQRRTASKTKPAAAAESNQIGQTLSILMNVSDQKQQ